MPLSREFEGELENLISEVENLSKLLKGEEDVSAAVRKAMARVLEAAGNVQVWRAGALATTID